MAWSNEYRSPAAFWAAATARAKTQARTEGRPARELTGELVRQMFLARLFRTPHTPWAVAGGTGILIRLPGARTTNDLDLIRSSPPTAGDLADSITEHTGTCPEDPFDFQIQRTTNFAGEVPGVKVRLRGLIDGRRAHEFDVDLTTKPTIGRVETITPTSAVRGLRGIAYPPVTVWPVASQVADKLAAMYRHTRTDQPGVSTRYRDLVDLTLLATNTSTSSTDLAAAIAQIRAAGYNLPTTITNPGGQWPANYPAAAAGTRLPRNLHSLDTALDVVGAWLNPILSGQTSSAHGWDPRSHQWIPGDEIVPAGDEPDSVFIAEHTRDDGQTHVTSHRRRKPQPNP